MVLTAFALLYPLYRRYRRRARGPATPSSALQ
jgi:hypothetical protein